MHSIIDRILEGFPFPTIAPIIGPLNYKTISELHMKLNSNAASIQYNLGDGALGLLYLTVSPTVYTTLSTAPYVRPVNPGSKPIVSDVSTSPVIVDLRYAFKLANDIFTEYYQTNKSLRKILLASVDKIYVRSLRHRYIGYGQTTTRQLLDHTYAVYAYISPAGLQLNDAKLRTPYNANHPIKTLIDQVETAVKYAAAVNTPYSSE